MIPVMNVKRQYESLQMELDKAVLDVLHSGQYILGETVAEFEKKFAEYNGVAYAVGVGNGTDALTIALRACGVQEGDEVITTAMSFFATAEAIASVGAIPVFVDCTKDTCLLDVTKVESKITSKTKAIIPVHLYGQCVDMDALMRIANQYHLRIIEDVAQAIGAEYKGRKAGSIGDIACVSFFPTKNLGAAGDGGIIITDNENLYRKCCALRVHGSGENGFYMYQEEREIEMEQKPDFQGNLPKYFNYVVGYNSRLDALQAALLQVKLPYLNQWNRRRQGIAKLYDERIKNPYINKLSVHKDNSCSYYVYVIMTERRNEFRKYLEENGIGTGIYFPVPLHLQKVFESLGYKKGDMPNAEYVAEYGVAIPMFPELEDDEIEYIIKIINQWQ